MSFTAAVDHLLALTPELSPSAPRRKFDLEHMRILARALGDPQACFPAVLIAGTNGKGSTAATLASILTAAGLRTGLYTSPHLTRVTERIRVSAPRPSHPPRTSNLEPRTSLLEIPEEAFARLYFRVDETANRLVTSGQLPHHPSFFETLTALAFLYFADRPADGGAGHPVDIAVLEVGLGGRLDATNIVHPLLSVITDIALDHQDYLGSTIAEIAREKAGILRPNGTLITLPQHPEANQAIGEAAIALNTRAISATPYLPDRAPDQDASRYAKPWVCLTPPDQDASRYAKPRVCLTPPDQDASRYAKPRVCLTPPDQDASRYAKPWVCLTPPDQDASRYAKPRVGLTPPDQDASRYAKPSGLALIGQPEIGALAPGADVRSSPLPPNHYDLHLNGETLHIRSPLPGSHQQRNIALAIAAALELLAAPTSNLEPRTSNLLQTIELGIVSTHWPGRLEFLPPNLLLDVAHNPAGAWTLRAAISSLPESAPRGFTQESPRTLIFSCLRDKDLTEISRILFPLFDAITPNSACHSDPEGNEGEEPPHLPSAPACHSERSEEPPHWPLRPSNLEPRTLNLILTPIDSPRAASLDSLIAAARALSIPAHTAQNATEALALARSLTPPDGLIVATGSIYLIGALRTAALSQSK